MNRVLHSLLKRKGLIAVAIVAIALTTFSSVFIVQQPHTLLDLTGPCARTGLDNGVYVQHGWPLPYFNNNIDECIQASNVWDPSAFIADLLFWGFTAYAIFYGFNKIKARR